MQDNDNSLTDSAAQKTEDAKAALTELGETTKRQTRAVGEELRDTSREKFRQGRDEVYKRVADVAGAADHAAADLRERGELRMADWVERGAEELQSFAEGIRKQDVDSLVQQTRSLARSSPAVFIGSSLIAGVLLGRLLRSAGEAS